MLACGRTRPQIFEVEPTGSGEDMIKRVVFLFAILALGVADAETYKVTLFQPAVVQGKELKAGQYKLDLQNSKLVDRQRQAVGRDHGEGGDVR